MTTGVIKLREGVMARQVCEACVHDPSYCRRSPRTGKVLHARSDSGAWTTRSSERVQAKIETELHRRGVRYTYETGKRK